MNRKSASVVAVLIMLAALLYAVSTGAEQRQTNRSVLCTFWPEYVFAANVLSGIDGVTLEIMIPTTGSPHGYMPTPDDLKKLDKADIIIANGLLEEFLVKVRQTFKGKKFVCTTDAVRLLPNEKSTVEHEEKHEGHEHGEYNPHTWLSVMNAIVEVDSIRAALTSLMPEKSDLLLANAMQYQLRLMQLRSEMLSASFKFKDRNIVTFHNGFDYLAAELGLNVVAVIMEVPGLSPSPAEIMSIIEKVKKAGGAAVFAEPQFPKKIADMIADNLGIKTYVIDPGVTTEPAIDGYEKVMRANIAAMSLALGAK